jgi:hypothetical protein
VQNNRRGNAAGVVAAGLVFPRSIVGDCTTDAQRAKFTAGLNVTMSGWIKIGVEFIKALPGQWKGSSDPNAPSEIVDTMAEEVPRADSMAVGDESQIGVTAEASASQQEIERRREIVRQFFNDFWASAEDKPGTFAERLNRAEGHINERLAARGETWQLDAASRKQLGLPPPKTV